MIFSGGSFFRRDILRFYYPMWKYGATCLKGGEIPLWNPLVNMGQPFLANVQTCAFYPLTVLFFLPSFLWAFNSYIVLHLVLAGFFTYLWMRDCEVSHPSAILAALAYSLSGYSMSTMQLTISLCSAAYFPLVLLCFRRALLDRSFLWKSLTGVTLLFQYLAGDPAIFIGSVLVLSFFTVYLVLREFLAQKRWVLGPGVSLIQVFAVFFGLSAFQSLLFAELIGRSMRVDFVTGEKMLWSMQYNDLVSIAVPFFSDLSMYVMNYWSRQSWLENYYAGVTVLALAGLSGLFRKRNARLGCHWLLAILGLGMALGSHSLIYVSFYKFFPLLNFVRYPIRFFYIFSFAVACLAGFGLEGLSKKDELKNWAVRLIGIGLIVLLVAVLWLTLSFDSIVLKLFESAKNHFSELLKYYYTEADFMDSITATLNNAKRSLIFLSFSLAAFFAALTLKVRRAVLVSFIGVLALLDLSGGNVVEPAVKGSLIETLSPNLKVILKDQDTKLFRISASPQTAREQNFHDAAGFVAQWQDQKERLVSSFMMVYGLYDFMGYDSVILREVDNVQKIFAKLKLSDPKHLVEFQGYRFESRIMDLLNVKYVASPNPRLTGPLKLVRKSTVSHLYLNQSYLPRAFLVQNAVIAKTAGESLEKIMSKDFDPLKTVYLEESPPALSSGRTPPVPERLEKMSGGVTISKYSAELVRMTAEVGLEAPWLFFSDAYYPGWVAEVDGKPTKIYKANYAFRAIRLSPGNHEIVWRYDPILFKVGSAITLATLFALMVYYLKIGGVFTRMGNIVCFYEAYRIK